MEPVGAVSSVLTLIKAATILAGSTRELARKFRNAPQELHTVAAQLLLVQSELEHVKQTTYHANRSILTSDLCKEIDDTIRQARDAVADVDAIVSRAQENRSLTAKIRWVSKERKVVEDLLASLRLARDRLMFLLQILSW